MISDAVITIQEFLSKTRTKEKAQLMKVLFFWRKEAQWISKALNEILNNSFEYRIAAYRARAKRIIKKINKSRQTS